MEQIIGVSDLAVSFRKGLAILAFFGVATTAYHLLSSRRKKPISRLPINEVLTFSTLPDQPTNKADIMHPILHPSMDRLLHYLSLAQYTMDICMEMITSLDIACQLLDIHRRGVTIRLIVDGDMAYAPASAVKLLEKQGIEVRIATVDSMFKNFCLIDASADILDDNIVPFSIFGSLTWTKEALSGTNDEMVFVTSRLVFINVFKEEFERLHTAAI